MWVITEEEPGFSIKVAMRFFRKFAVGLSVVAVLTSAGCKKRKPPVPAQSQPPSLSQPTVPPVASQPQPTPPTVSPEPPQPASTNPAPATKNKTRIRRKKPVPTQQANATTTPPKPTSGKPDKPADPDTNVNISAEVPQNAANERRQQTESLLQAAEGNLKRISHTLSDGEDSMQRQVRNFITQSRLAMQDGDLERAFNLATKANLLSQELAK